MPAIIRPVTDTGQPQYAVPLDDTHWLRKDIVFAYSAGRGTHDGAHGAGSMVGSMDFGAGPSGRNVLPLNASSYLEFPHHNDYNVLGEITVIALIRVGAITTQQGIVTKCETSGGSNTPFGLFTDNTGTVCLNRANVGGGTPFRVWQSVATVASGWGYVLAVTQGADIGVAPKFYLNGTFDTGAPTNLYGGTVAVGAPTGNTTTLKIGNRTDLASRCLHGIYDALVIKRILSQSEITEITRSLWAVWEPEDPFMIWAPDSVGSTVYTLSATSTAFNCTTQPATLRAHRRLIASSQAYSTIGNNAVLRSHRKLLATSAAFSCTSQSARLIRRYRLAASAASCTTTGQSAVLRAHRRILATPAAFHLTTRTADLIYSAAPIEESAGILYPWIRRRRR